MTTKRWTWNKKSSTNMKALGTAKYMNVEFGAEIRETMKLLSVGSSSYYRDYTVERDRWFHTYVEENEPVPLREAAERLNISVATLAKLVRAGHVIPTVETRDRQRGYEFIFRDLVQQYLMYTDTRRVLKRVAKPKAMKTVVTEANDFSVNHKPINWEMQVQLPEADKGTFNTILKSVFGVGAKDKGGDKIMVLERTVSDLTEENLVLRRLLVKMQQEMDARQ
jgi:predicted transcriptional regulator